MGMSDVGEEAEGGGDGVGEERMEMEEVLDDLDLSEDGSFQYTDEGLDDVGPENDG